MSSFAAVFAPPQHGGRGDDEDVTPNERKKDGRFANCNSLIAIAVELILNDEFASQNGQSRQCCDRPDTCHDAIYFFFRELYNNLNLLSKPVDDVIKA